MRKKYRRIPQKGSFRTYTLGLILLIIVIALSSCWAGNLQAVSDSSQKQAFVVSSGMTASQVATELQKEELIRSAGAFRQLCRINQADSKLLAGMYYLSPSMSAREILNTLLKGPEPDVVRVTIPEGYNVAQIVGVLVENGLGSEENLYSAMQKFQANDYSFLADVPAGKNRLEGFLFPDTYFLDKKATPEETISRFLQRFGDELTKENKKRLKELNLSVYEWVIKASLVEKEAATAEERPLIAGVFDNRLRIGMPLQSCATVQYVLGKTKPILTLEDIEIDSPYNTYKHTGLPPGPIANPGDASLKAVLYPESTNYFYFVSKNDGTHAFAVTLEEHNRNVNTYE